MSPDICMVPLPNFTTYPKEVVTVEKLEKTGKFLNCRAALKIFIKLLRKIFIPLNPLRQNSNDGQFSPFLQVKKNNNAFFYIPAMEAAINSRWNQARTNWIVFLNKYFI